MIFKKNLDTVSIYRGNPVGGTNTKVKWIDGAAQDVRNLTLITTRGCPFRCRFCQPRYLGDAARSRSAEKICDAMERLVERYGVTSVFGRSDTARAPESSAVGWGYTV